MKKFKTYDSFAHRFNGSFAAMSEKCDFTRYISEAIWNRLAAGGLTLRDARQYTGGRTWTRFEQKDGLQVVVGWTSGGEIEAWSVPLEDCGAIEEDRVPWQSRTLDIWRFVRLMDTTSRAMRESTISMTIRALDLYGFVGTPDEFKVDVVGSSTFSIAKELASYDADAIDFDMLARDDNEEVRTWKHALLMTAAAFGGYAPEQRELAWRVDPGNEMTVGYRKDRVLAMYWYEMAAQRGDGLAAHNLACLYQDDGDCAKAKHWFRVAKKAGVEESVTSLRHCEVCGEGNTFKGMDFFR